MAVVTAGVVFNAISALIVFMVVFLIGIKLPPAVVGGVVPDSPAAQAGLQAGDEIIEIAGENDNLDFSNIAIAAALSDVNEAVSMKAKRADGSIEDFSIVAEQFPGMPTKVFGIDRPMSLTVAEVSDADELLSRTGLLSGDRIKAVNGKDVQSHWELEGIVEDALLPEVRVLAERGGELIEARIRLSLSPVSGFNLESESDLSHICSMVPRMRITMVLGRPATAKDKLQDALNKIGIGKVESEPGLQEGDIILAVGDIENPTFKELREVASEYEDKELVVKVLRKGSEGVEESRSITVVPRRPPGSEQVMIGIGVALDAEHPVVAKTISVEGGPEGLAIPRGALITAVDGRSVSDLYEVVREIRGCSSERITIDWRVNEEMAGDVSLEADTREDLITVKSSFADFVPFEDLRRLYKASGPAEAIVMGYKKTVMFVAQAYMTVKRLIGGLVSPKSLIGPVGIIAYSYRIVAEQPLVYYVYFLGLISAVIAVFNFLPLPPLDGGLIVLLLVEKIKGSALSERTQGIAAYAGWVLIGSFFLYVTFNDIVRSFFR
jgi:regulator of sigma E protease